MIAEPGLPTQGKGQPFLTLHDAKVQKLREEKAPNKRKEYGNTGPVTLLMLLPFILIPFLYFVVYTLE